jgi:hypothetical protein
MKKTKSKGTRRRGGSRTGMTGFDDLSRYS